MTSTPKRKKKEKKADRGTSAEQTSADQASKEESAPSARSKLAKYAVVLVVIVLATAGGLFAIDYFNRAPLREARQKLAEEDYNYALVVLKEYSANHPDDKIAKSLMGRAYAGLKDYEKCISIYEEIEGAFEFEDMFAFGKALTVNSKFNEAYNNWIGVMGLINEGALDDWELKKKNVVLGEALYMMAICQTQLGQHDRSLQTARDLLNVDGNELHGQYLLGLVYAKKGAEAEAIEAWEKVREMDPSVSRLKIPAFLFFYELGVLKVAGGFSEDGIEILKQSLTHNQFDSILHACECMEQIGVAYEELGDSEQAEFYWKKLIQFEAQTGAKPSYIAREGLANFALQNQKPKESIAWMVQLKQAGIPDRSSSTYIMQRAHAMLGNDKLSKEFGDLTKSLRDTEMRLKTIRQAIKSQSGTYWTQVIRAYDFAREKNWDQARQLLVPVKDQIQDKFSRALYDAVQQETELPSLAEVPLDLF